MLDNLLIYRFVVFNALMAVLMGLLAARGLPQQVIEGDRSHIVFAVGALFAVAWLWTARKSWRTSRDFNRFKKSTSPDGRNDPERQSSEFIHALRDKELGKLDWLHDAAGWMVGLGLLGTVVGFIMALGGVTGLGVSNAGDVQDALTILVDGMGVALNTTLAGGALGLWTEVNTRMLRTTSATFWADVIMRHTRLGS